MPAPAAVPEVSLPAPAADTLADIRDDVDQDVLPIFLEEAAELDSRLGPIAEQLASAHRELEDASRELGAYARGVVHDPARLAEVDERLDALSRVARKCAVPRNSCKLTAPLP